ncbi:hypothetical protein BABINDRAFT_158924 [Babjeviella inositovora NRRL Y-12698]|uniref:Trafficking protein particle complex subunit n=1 Tax=Babjeviella inositovora NRRL Y-12698 TaxID=984486 RepID=A0A1E3QXG3_9ASCO|nr:uncharacterized protein BABINDRAFT_158924 [Babjeviella inositovora NRRL Y-12698]ODQ82301.1 hypothetical protein BABINDRAFT_158924 [Babjeviella inositovora NRRL Y-12698]
MTIYSLYILNKAGGLIYQTDPCPGLNKLSANEYLVLAGTLHGVHAIASRISPTAPTPNTGFFGTGKAVAGNCNTSGLKSLETDAFAMYVFQTVTGLKFVLVTAPGTRAQADAAELVLCRIYECYADYVMKNPYYSLDMPIRCDMFDEKVVEVTQVVV